MKLILLILICLSCTKHGFEVTGGCQFNNQRTVNSELDWSQCNYSCTELNSWKSNIQLARFKTAEEANIFCERKRDTMVRGE